MEDPKTSQASSADTFKARPQSRPNLGPLTFNRNISQILWATPYLRVQARKTQLVYRSLPPFPLYPLPFWGLWAPKLVKMGVDCKIRQQCPRNRCIQFLLQKCEIGVILSDMSRHARPTPSGLCHPGHPS